MEPSQDKLLDLKKPLNITPDTPKRIKTEPEVSTYKLIFFFLLAIIPALLLGYIFIYGASKLESRQKQDEELYQSYQQEHQYYPQYQDRSQQLIIEEDRRKKGVLGSLYKMNQELEDQKEVLRLQQEQLNQEQQRIQMLLQQSRKR
ncbi:MAG: hypothetical protein HZB36_05730 [Candidatus Omnitrophica bacterium]|nr:hypothetical protein [Candidatus Omnitrophota bacterium]